MRGAKGALGSVKVFEHRHRFTSIDRRTRSKELKVACTGIHEGSVGHFEAGGVSPLLASLPRL